MKPEISIIIPLHNAESYANELLRHLDALPTEATEILLVDDHSTDLTAAIAREWASRPGSIIRVLSSERRGVAAARNLAASEARGEFLWFGDGDDSWSPAITTLLASAARRTEADIVICNAQKVFPDARTELIEDARAHEQIDGAEALRRLFTGSVQGHLWNKLFRRALFDRETFPPTRAHSDLGGILGLFARASVVAFLPETLYNYRIHAGSILNNREYRWSDLGNCLELAQAAAGNLASNQDVANALLFFKYSNVILPLSNEAVRRERWEPAVVLTHVWNDVRSQITLRDLVRLLLTREPGVAAKASLIKLAPAAYRSVYRTRRRRKWGALDAL